MAVAGFPQRILASCAFMAFGLVACSEGQTVTSSPPTPEVSVVTVVPEPRAIIRELPGRIAPTRIAEVRARVSGIVVERPFNQGADVAAGDVLYRIDPAPFEVELQAQEAALAKAEAVLTQAQQHAERTKTLAQGQTASRVQLETAIANLRQAEADVAARRAEVRRAKLNLDYATVRAPISGRIGRAMVTEGALVGQNEATHLATVQHLDTVYADFTQSISELNELQRALENGDLERIKHEAARVRLKLDDDTIYPHVGRLLFSEATVDLGTGQVRLRGEFPNPKRELLPGMYVRVLIEQGIDSDSLAVPQQAIQRNGGGDSEVFVVDSNNTATRTEVRTGPIIDDSWMVLDGLKSGDRVVVEGFQKISDGTKVVPSPWKPQQARAGQEVTGMTRSSSMPASVETR
jgi:membrane fusion protein (multidrug efflux system)